MQNAWFMVDGHGFDPVGYPKFEVGMVCLAGCSTSKRPGCCPSLVLELQYCDQLSLAFNAI